jgi:protein BUR2
LITAAARFSQRNWELEIDEQSKEYWKWRDTILYTEEHLLEALCFDFDITHPYDYLLALVQRFAPGNSVLGKCAWAFINDRYFRLLLVHTDFSHRTMVQIMYPPNVIAAAAFYFARKFTHSDVPRNPEGKEWWEQYGVKIEPLRGIPLFYSLLI